MEQNWLMGLYPEIMEMKEIENMLSGCNNIGEVKGKVSNWIWNVIDEMEAIDEKDITSACLLNAFTLRSGVKFRPKSSKTRRKSSVAVSFCQSKKKKKNN